jgi:N-acetyl-gamma-glutamyl-phosphate reductase
MPYKVFVDGQEGTTGLRINEYLSQRRDITLLQIEPELRKDRVARQALINAADVVFLCLPDDAAREAVALTENPETCLIDASTAHRTHADWVYGLPEIDSGQRDKLRRSKRIAVGGCHATAFILLLRPLVQAGLITPETLIQATSITGYSGGGKKLIAQYEQAMNPRLASPRPYALGMNHKHLPEMRFHSKLSHPPLFVPIVADFYKGLAVTVPLPIRHLGVSLQDIHICLSEYYQHEAFVAVLPLGAEENLDQGYFDVQACNDTNRVDLGVFGNDERAALIGRLDNLGKGAAGAAIQCMNIHLGVDEATGL